MDMDGGPGPFATVSGTPVDAVYGSGPPPGEYPYTRGIHPSMYRSRLWTMRMFAGFGTAEDTNARFRELLGADQLTVREQTDPSVIGGIRVTTPSRVYDATVQHRLTKLRERKV